VRAGQEDDAARGMARTPRLYWWICRVNRTHVTGRRTSIGPCQCSVGPRPLLRWAHHDWRRHWSGLAELLGYLGFPVTPMPARMLAREVDYDRFKFSTAEKRRWGHARGGAQSAPVSGSDCATAQAACYLGSRCPVTPIFDCRETVIGPRDSHLETLRRTQTAGASPQRTVSEAYSSETSICHTRRACTHPNGARGTRAANLDVWRRTMKRP
jgi:hypothetical protein